MPKGFGKMVGTEVHNAKLDDDKAREIYHATGCQRELAEQYGISQTLVSFIKHGRSWRHATQIEHKGKIS